jgi:hypothetical protein
MSDERERLIAILLDEYWGRIFHLERAGELGPRDVTFACCRIEQQLRRMAPADLAALAQTLTETAPGVH